MKTPHSESLLSAVPPFTEENDSLYYELETDSGRMATVYGDDDESRGDAARLAACWNAAIGLQLPEDCPPGILRDLVAAVTDYRYDTENRPAYHLERMFTLLAKLSTPAAGTPGPPPLSLADFEALAMDYVGSKSTVEISALLDAAGLDPQWGKPTDLARAISREGFLPEDFAAFAEARSKPATVSPAERMAAFLSPERRKELGQPESGPLVMTPELRRAVAEACDRL